MTTTQFRLLLVEDKKHDFALSKRALERSQLAREIVWVQKGIDALNLLQAETFDAITLDFQLPDMNGLEVLEKIVEKRLDVPVIFVTGSGNEQVAVQAIKKGAQHYLVKGPAGQYLELLPAVIEQAHRQWQDRKARRLAKRMKRELRLEHERMRILADFITNASHEFRTPLSIMKTKLYLLGKTPDVEKRQHHSQTIEDQINRIAALVDDLVAMAKLDGMDSMKSEAVQINQVLSTLQTTMQSAITARQQTLVLHLADNLPPVQGDEEQLLTAFERLLDNAMRYTPEGGTITLSTDCVNDGICVEVQDTGIGIEPEIMARIFERFYRADTAHSTQGFGLGLPIAKAIIEKHGGQLTVASTVGQGSTFRVMLPLPT